MRTVILAVTALILGACMPCPDPEPTPCIAAPGLYLLEPVFELDDPCRQMNIVPPRVEVEVEEGTKCGELTGRAEEGSVARTVTAYADAEGLWAGTLIVAYENGTCGYSLVPAED